VILNWSSFTDSKYIINNSIKNRDAYYLNNLFIGTSSTGFYSGYIVSSISDSVITFDIVVTWSYLLILLVTFYHW
jgi:hypothetical protein